MRSLVAKDRQPLAPAHLLDHFAEYMKLDVAQGGASPETIRTYWSQVNSYVAWCAEMGVHPAEATEGDVKAYRAELISQGKERTTVASQLTAIRRFYAMAQARGYRPDNPADGIKAPRDKTDRAARVKWLPLTAIHELLNAPDRGTVKGRRDRAMLHLMAVHGLRVMEVAGLGLQDVDLERKTITVHGKGQKIRLLPIVEQTVRALQDWLEVRDTVAADGEAMVFVSTRSGGNRNLGHGMSRRGIRKVVDSHLERLGLKGDEISCHALRHSFATLSRAAGARLDVLSRVLGHASVTTTQVYADIVDMAAENPSLLLMGALEEIAD